MIYGVDYYPEHWPAERIDKDFRLMKEADINTVRLAEFTWSLVEPEENLYRFNWLDLVLEKAVKNGLSVVMCTPTAAPPKWLMDKHPEIYPIDEYGHVRGFGSRRHYCFNNGVFRDYSKSIVREFAKRYAGNENIIAWQLDNEFGCHDTARCYCPECSKSFSLWLEKKYGDISTFNEDLGMSFWGQHYPSFESVTLPVNTVCDNKREGMFAHNPGLFLEYCRFASDSVADYAKMQVDELRKAGVDVPITHNMMGNFHDIDYFDLAEELDFVSWDCYPNLAHGSFTSFRDVSYNHDKTRGYKNAKFWVMEQSSGQGGWNYMLPTPDPRQLRLWTYQSVSHGADGIVFFRWRPCLFGTEQYWHGILNHDGTPGKRYEIVKKTGGELKKISDIATGTGTRAQTCILYSFDNTWSHSYQKHSETFNYNTLLHTIHGSLTEMGINCDVTGIDSDLSAYRLVILPAYNIVSGEDVMKLEDYVENGGHVAITFRSGNRDGSNRINGLPLPGLFSKMCGIRVVDYDAAGKSIRKVATTSGVVDAYTWCDVIEEDTAVPTARYLDGFYKGSTAASSNAFGKGMVHYIGFGTDGTSYMKLLDGIAASALVDRPPVKNVPGAEIVERADGDDRFFFVLNHNSHQVMLRLDGLFKDVLSGKQAREVLELEAFDVAVLYLIREDGEI